MGTSVERSSAQTDFSKRGAAFDIPGEQVDGMDVLAVRDAGRARRRMRALGKGPYMLEMKTYRYRGHSMSDPAKYRTKEEVQKVRDRARSDRAGARATSRSKGIASEDEVKKVDGEIRDLVNEAAEFATNEPEPDVSELCTDVCAIERRALDAD